MSISQINTAGPNFAAQPRIAPESPMPPGFMTNSPVIQAGRDMSGAVSEVRNFERQGERDARADMVQDRSRQDAALEKMLRDPKNAEYYSQTFNIPITPELQGLLQEPEKAQQLADAYKMANDTGIKNYEAKKLFVQKYMETGGNMVEATAAIGKLDPREDMTRYQEESLDVQRLRAARVGSGSGRARQPIAVPLGFDKVARQMIDESRGVDWNDPKHPDQGVTDDSSAPMDDASMQKVLARAAQYYQTTRDPHQAVMLALQEMGGEQGLEDTDEVAVDNWDMLPFGWGSPDVHYKRLKTAPAAPGAAPAAGAPAAPAAPAVKPASRPAMPTGQAPAPATADGPGAPAAPAATPTAPKFGAIWRGNNG